MRIKKVIEGLNQLNGKLYTKDKPLVLSMVDILRIIKLSDIIEDINDIENIRESEIIQKIKEKKPEEFNEFSENIIDLYEILIEKKSSKIYKNSMIKDLMTRYGKLYILNQKNKKIKFSFDYDEFLKNYIKHLFDEYYIENYLEKTDEEIIIELENIIKEECRFLGINYKKFFIYCAFHKYNRIYKRYKAIKDLEYNRNNIFDYDNDDD